MNIILKVIGCFFLMANVAQAGVSMVRITDDPKEDSNVYWQCQSNSSGSDNVCTFDPDGSGPQSRGYVYPGGSVDTVYSEPGFYEVSLGSAYCSGIGPCTSFNSRTDRFPVAPRAGWKINLTGDTRGKVGERLSFTATGSTGKECCVYQWNFDDGDKPEDYETDGTSTQTHTFDSAGTYTVEVFLEDKKGDDDLYNGSQKVRDTLRVVIEAAPEEDVLLGGMNLDYVCRQISGDSNGDAILINDRFGTNAAYGWRCKANGTTTYFNMNTACQISYPGQNAFAKVLNTNDAYSWKCFK